ncbi:ABC transporter substrate-binding protein [Paenibacillus sp. IB182496]|uniref:ABC transporter substrate-binding protein n=1 Tax=Paenibacillus sabuli TaxID=2772509 RepID=A0A927GSY1_9BACL|nr:ABC transporter substrate-binding protein [Paenibacillus sabuli]MBD2847038.1 ABC transporter substrate-binding protein [Paenibacillus sabuli]
MLTSTKTGTFRFVLVAVLMLLLQACQAGEETTPAGANAGDETSTTASGTQTRSDEGGTDGRGGTLVVAMTAGNVPLPDIVPTEGSEGRRFVTYQLYDGLVRWDLSRDDATSVPRPGLAESWDISEDMMTWTFHLREGVKFHDGTDWNADAAVFGLDRILNQESEWYSASLGGAIATYTKKIDSYEKIDDYTLAIHMKEPYALLHWDLTWVRFASPDAVKTYGNDGYIQHPVGTGPFRFVSMEQGVNMILEPNTEYWGEVPKLDQLILRPMPEASSRLAALQTGEVNWAEVPPPESMEMLRQEGFQVLLNNYPHMWPIILNLQVEPWDNKLVRQAANYAIDRDGMANDLLGGAANPAVQFMYEGHDWYSEDGTTYSYDPEKAKELLAEAGYPDGFETVFVVPSSGSGNMWPLPMIEFLQQNLAEVGIDVEVEVMEWGALIQTYRPGFPPGENVGGVMVSTGSYAPMHAFDRNFASTSVPPAGNNKGLYDNQRVDELLREVQVASEEEFIPLMKELNSIVTDDAPWLFVVHDLNLRVVASNVKGVVMAQNWFIDLDTVWVE